ncbi:MAG: hypothetical protein PHC58_05560 [Candidatus Omnitrophica bacterium]|nr:hypothetical protein [Candidatus Omnitrophota bacterium]
MKKTIILGAGASMDFGFPTGLQLCEAIHSCWNSPSMKYISFLLTSFARSGNKFNHIVDPKTEVANDIKRLSKRFYYSGAGSIDEFLSRDLKPFQVSFGKMTILNLILEKERESITTISEKKIFRWGENWLRILFGKEFRFKSEKELMGKLDSNPVRFITFNYDRTLEHFIFNALMNYYNLTREQAFQLYQKIEIFHVYGKLAPLEWESKNNEVSLKYGEDVSDILQGISDLLYSCVSNIKVIDEDREEEANIINKCQHFIIDSDRVYLLGFGFLESNYSLLGIEEYKASCLGKRLPKGKFIYTTHGLSLSKKGDISKKFAQSDKEVNRALPYDSKIFDFMEHHY